MKRLAVNKDGLMTYCSVPEELSGMGRCNHIFHQGKGQTDSEFVESLNEMKEQYGMVPGLQNLGTFNKDKQFVPDEGTTVSLKPFHISEEESKNMREALGPKDLRDRDFEGGYISTSDALWTDMDINTFSEKSGISSKDIKSVLHGERAIVFSSDDSSYPVGKIVDIEEADELEKKNILAEPGVSAINSVSEQMGYTASERIYVLPYYMRQGTEDYDSDITSAYIYLCRTKKDPDRQQVALERLLNNAEASDSKYFKGYETKSLADQFAGKSGIFRSELSGSSISYSSRTVISPSTEIKFGEIAIPPYVASTIFKPALKDQLKQEGYSDKEIKDKFDSWRAGPSSFDSSVYQELDDRLSRANVRVIMNRQPSLHTSSLQSFKPRVSSVSREFAVSGRASKKAKEMEGYRPTCAIRPEYCKAFAADFDGDCVSLYGLNDQRAVIAADKELDTHLDINTHSSSDRSKVDILPNKDSLWGLLNILQKRSN